MEKGRLESLEHSVRSGFYYILILTAYWLDLRRLERVSTPRRLSVFNVMMPYETPVISKQDFIIIVM